MTSSSDLKTQRSTIRRVPRNARYDRDSVYHVLDRGLVAHISFTADRQPYCIPTLYARVDDRVLVHGSTASRMMRVLASGSPACFTVTLLDGLVLARSVFETGANYDSVMLLGRFHLVDSGAAKLDSLKAFVDAVVPGRWDEVRPPTAQELKATAVLELEITEASVKNKSGGPDDDDTLDAQHDTWAGVLPLVTTYGAPQPSPVLRADIELSPSVRERLACPATSIRR